MRVRRVVTGHDAAGRARFVSDAFIEPLGMPGLGDLYRIWSADQPATYPDAGQNPEASDIFPPLGGFRFFVFTIDPQPADAASASPETKAALTDAIGQDTSGLHATDTTDFEVVLSGEATLDLDDGSSVVLKAGDTVVHNGAAHRWRNTGTVPAVLAGCLIGARRRTK